MSAPVTAQPAGYSGTPLAKKLGLAENGRVFAKGAPADYAQWLAPVPAGVVFESGVSPATDIVHLFAERRAALQADLQGAAHVDQAERHGLGLVAEEGVEAADRHHRRHDPRTGAAARFRRREGVRG